MEQTLAEKLAAEMRIDITQVVREYWEIIVLKELSEAEYARDLIFKGGTALRLVYNSPRFSEDLDFSLKKDVLKGKLSHFIKKIVSKYKEMSLTDIAEKYYTYLAEIKITEGYLNMPFRIKVEISRRILGKYNSELKLITSTTSPTQLIFNVAALQQLYEDKVECLKGRTKPKDVFDLWFVSQRLKIPYVKSQSKIPKQTLRRDLRKYLPANYWDVIEVL